MYARPSPSLPARCSTSTASCSAAIRSAIAPVPSGELSSTISSLCSGEAAASRGEHGRDDRLDVLGLVVGREHEPGAGHSAYPRPGMRNAEIALHFDELADLYELDGAIVHRVLAYRNAAKAIRDAPASIEEMTRAGTVTELRGIGKTIEEKLNALLDTGEIPSATKLKAKFPPGLVEITRIPGFGPKKARKLFDELGVASLDDLRKAAEERQAARRARLRPEGRGERAAGARRGRRPAAEAAPAALAGARASRTRSPRRCASTRPPSGSRWRAARGAGRGVPRTSTSWRRATTPEALAEAFCELPLIGEVVVLGGRGRARA